MSIEITSSWIVEDGIARPLGTKRKLLRGQHKRTARQEATRRRRAREEQMRRRGRL